MATKRRKSVRRRVIRRRRAVGSLAGLPEEHRQRADMLKSSIQDQLDNGKTFANRGDCELALHRLVGAAKNSGAYVAERIGAENPASVRDEANKLEAQVGQLRDTVKRCFIRKNQ